MNDECVETWESRVATAWAAQIWCRPENEKRKMDVDFAQSIAQAMQPYLAPFALLAHPDVHSRLREIATMLKHRDGEQWAVGEALERICMLLDFHTPTEATEVVKVG
jgi:hypothetical protein